MSISPSSQATAVRGPDNYQAAMLKKAKEQQQLEGKAAQQLIDSAAPRNVGKMVNDVA